MNKESTRMSRHLKAAPSIVYDALVNANAVANWMVPTGMTSQVHEFDGRQGGRFRISLTYEEQSQAGKTAGRTDTYHGWFVELVPDKRVVEKVEFETDDPLLQGEMTITFDLEHVDGGTRLLAVHDELPSGLSPSDNEAGWQSSLDKLAALVERRKDG